MGNSSQRKVNFCEEHERQNCAIQLVGVAPLRFLSLGTDGDAVVGHPHIAKPELHQHSKCNIEDPVYSDI